MIELVVEARAGRLKDYDYEVNGWGQKTFQIPSEDRAKYSVEIDTDAVYISTKMPQIEVVDRTVIVGIPTEVWDVLRGI